MPVYDNEDESPEADDTMPCPYCGKSIHEESVRCPHCENYISEEEETGPGQRPIWVVVGMILALLVAAMWALGG